MLYSLSNVKENVVKSLEIMGYGVHAVFIVIAILIILVKLMQYIEKRVAEKKAKEGYKPLKEKMKGKFVKWKETRAEKRIMLINEKENKEKSENQTENKD